MSPVVRIQHAFGGVEPDRHLGELVADRAEAWRSAARTAGGLIAYCAASPSARFRAARAHRGELEAAVVEHVERDLVARGRFRPAGSPPARARPAARSASSTSRAGPSCVLPCRSTTPGNPRSTMNAENCSPSTLAKTMKRSAKPPFVIHIFSPVIDQDPSADASLSCARRAHRIPIRIR